MLLFFFDGALLQYGRRRPAFLHSDWSVGFHIDMAGRSFGLLTVWEWFLELSENVFKTCKIFFLTFLENDQSRCNSQVFLSFFFYYFFFIYTVYGNMYAGV